MKPKRPPPVSGPPPVGKPSGAPPIAQNSQTSGNRENEIAVGLNPQDNQQEQKVSSQQEKTQIAREIEKDLEKENEKKENEKDKENEKQQGHPQEKQEETWEKTVEEDDEEGSSEEKIPYEPPPELLWNLCEQLQKSFWTEMTSQRQFKRRTDYVLVRKLGNYAPSIELFLGLQKHALSEILEPNRYLSGLQFDNFTIRSAIGKGVVTIETPYTTNLMDAQSNIDAALDTMIEVGTTKQIRVLSYGALPFDTFDAQMISPIYHFFSLYNSIGPAWASMAYVARDRLVVQVTKDEVLDFLYIGQLMEPVFLALFGHSPIIFGKDTYRHCGNQWLLDGMFESSRELRRFGIEPPRSSLAAGRISMPQHPVLSWQQLTEEFVKADKLMHRDAEGWLEMFSGRFLDFLEQDGTDIPIHWKDHVCFSWGPVSVDMDQSTISFQSADQQPFEYRSCFAALVLGILERRKEILHFIDGFMPEPPWRIPFGLRQHEIVQRELDKIKDPWPPFWEWRKIALEKGICNTKIPFTGLLEGVIEEATTGLIRRGLGEEVLLKPIWNKFHRDETNELRRMFYHCEKEDFLSHVEVVAS